MARSLFRRDGADPEYKWVMFPSPTNRNVIAPHTNTSEQEIRNTIMSQKRRSGRFEHPALTNNLPRLGNHPQVPMAYWASYLSAFFEFESADMAAPYHAFIVNYVTADNFGHHGQIEVADFRIAFGERMKNTIGRLDSWQFLCRVDRPRLIA